MMPLLAMVSGSMAGAHGAGSAPAAPVPPGVDGLDWTLIMYVALAVICTAGAGVCAGAEMGLYSVNRIRLRLRARSGDPAAITLGRELEHTGRLLGALLICYNVLSYLAAVGITTAMRHAGFGDLAIVIANTLIITPILFVLVDAVPMEVFRLEPDRAIYRLVGPLKFARVVLTYTLVLPAVQSLAKWLSSLFRGGDESAILDARGRIVALLKEGAHHGALSEAQVGLLDRAIALRTTTIRDEMVPWSAAIRIDDSMSREQMMELIAVHPFSRFPVVAAGASASPAGTHTVLGVVETLDLCLSPEAPLSSLLRPVARLRERMSVRDGLLAMAAAGASMAIVIGEGPRETPRGLVTAKDLVEPLTGELKAF
ncbi:MAG: CNNM domain-containing protein [Phycisphaerales bacterium]